MEAPDASTRPTYTLSSPDTTGFATCTVLATDAFEEFVAWTAVVAVPSNRAHFKVFVAGEYDSWPELTASDTGPVAEFERMG